MRVVLLPGLDGTAALRADFVRAAPSGYDVDLVAYPSGMTSYDDLARFVAPRLSEPTGLLIAESFSGPLAVRLAEDQPGRIGGLVLIASFVSRPRRVPTALTALARLAPVNESLFAKAAAPLLIGRRRSASFAPRLAEAMGSAGSATLAGRLREALLADELATLGMLTVPILYLRASRDRLVPAAAADEIERHARNSSHVTLEGPHFLAQAAPHACWRAIERFARDLA